MSSTDIRELRLTKEWNNRMPCVTCNVANICKHANSIKRVDYPPDVFDVEITCKVKNNYRLIKEERL